MHTEKMESMHPTDMIELRLNTLRMLLVDNRLSRDVTLKTLKPLEKLKKLRNDNAEQRESVDNNERKLHADNAE